MSFRSRARRLARALAPEPAAVPERPHVLALDEIATLPRAALEDACRAYASPCYLGDRVAICRILTRYKFYVSTLDSGFGANVLLDGYWESWLTQFIARTVRPGSVAVDVGANFGYYSLLLGELVGPSGYLYAVEPNPSVARSLERSLALNGFAGRSEICVLAAGATEGRATLLIPPGEPKNAALIQGDRAAEIEGETIEVPVRPLDSVVARHGKIDFIKIDAEGAEEGIIDGMAGLFAGRPPDMVLEFNAARYLDPAAFLAKLTAIYGGLRHVDYDGNAVPISPERVASEHYGEDWLLFLRRT